MSNLEREYELLAAENERLALELRETTAKYTAIRDSLSWKITAPLRKAMDLFLPAKLLSGPTLLNEENYRRWVAQYGKLTEADRAAIRSTQLSQRPLFSLVVRVHDHPAAAILDTIQSIRRQIYREWEIYLMDEGSTAPHVARALSSCGNDPRVRIARNAALEPKGDYVASLEPGDRLAESALFEFAAAAGPDVLYCDEDSLDARGERCNPRFKTGWNPDLFAQQDYLGRLVFRKPNAAGKTVGHVPSVLCHTAAYQAAPVKRQVLDQAPRVSILIPTRDRAELLERCLDGIFQRTNYPSLEVVVLDNDSREANTRQLFGRYPIRVVDCPGEFNWSAMNNAGAKAATGEILLFLNNDTDVLEPNWLRELAAHAARPAVGAVGAKLLFADQTVQHAGIWLGPGGRVYHFLRLSKRDDPGYLGQLSITRNLSAVTGACLAIRRELFLEQGGFDESFPVSYNDLDLCLRLRQHGYRIVWTPHAELLHLESASRGSSEWRWRKEEADHKRFSEKWAHEMERDPFFNPNLDLIGEEKLALAFPPRIRKAWQR